MESLVTRLRNDNELLTAAASPCQFQVADGFLANCVIYDFKIGATNKKTDFYILSNKIISVFVRGKEQFVGRKLGFSGDLMLLIA